MGTVKNLLGLAVWLLITFAAGWIGSQYMPGAWYESLVKPSWNPPNAIFAPVWSVLYILIGIAAWLVWRRSGFSVAAAALSIFIVQLFLNTLWLYLFFGLHRPDMAFFDIVALWVSILIVMVLFWREDRYAGALLLPYLAWVSFALYLNFTLWQLN